MDPLLPLDVLSEECGFVSLYKGFALENLKRYEEAMKWFDNALKIFFSDEEMYERCKKHDPELLYVTYEEFAMTLRDILHDLLKKAVENDKKITENMRMSNGHGITPWWLFIIDLISLINDLVGDEFPPGGASWELIKYFKEFNRAPRISDSLAIEFEDFINDESEDSLISSRKEEIMDVFEQWRELKLEGQL
jgi:tetratricopeptide (TPR) repeat protein